MSQDFVKDITKRDVDFAQWYTDIVRKAELADYSSVKGCMVLRPAGYSLWENIQRYVDDRLKEMRHENVAMPMLIPEHMLLKEAEHVEGFAPEVAWVTHGGDSELAERLAIRPTSEVLFAEHFRNIIHSYRDLPKLYNQWVSVVRWEKTTRPFLRTTEFFWQEGHTCHVDHDDADREALLILDLYKEVCEEVLAIPVVGGRKTESERFAGAIETYTNETLMYDGKALQITTSHHLGDNFGKAFDIKYTAKDGKEKFVHQTSWAITTRSIGALIMVHGDDRGMVMPPRIAPVQVMIVPIAQNKAGVLENAKALEDKLHSEKIRVRLDDSDKNPGWKFNETEMKGIPVRIEMGPRDIENQQVIVVRRDTGEKIAMPMEGLTENIVKLLDEIQKNLFESAKKRADEKTEYMEDRETFNARIEKGGFAVTPWCGDASCEEKVKEETTATSRCMTFEDNEEPIVGKTCPHCGKEAKHIVHWAKAY
ncbi:proline--tRNA ligase [Enterococcus rivorum]|uniref:Proline--tRNA ligase n=1 Tax=Enterococcus rivorum TaxID=762845 RepID=A0A1E5KY02_9ENTE|nr:proline--tRNA ligase [Enterococcus rivorum]MBP2099703.1 prolyl-tRNA synthetase [Enterococcus rivorum]OEH82727.1 proline--tRNA ligase [Enterococcus rivorum]